MPAPEGFVVIDVPPDKPMVEQAAREAGINLFVLDGDWVAPDFQAEAARTLVDAYDPIPRCRTQGYARLADQMQRRGASLFGDQGTLNAELSFGLNVIGRKVLRGQDPTPEQMAQCDQLFARYDRRDELTAAAAAIRAAIDAETDPWAVLGFPVDDPARWPAWSVPADPPPDEGG
jgi:hypothetical protein